MTRFRLFLAWLIVAAIPLQGMAASYMPFCEMGQNHASAHVAAVRADIASNGSTVNAGHNHSKHSNVGDIQAPKTDSAGKKLPGTAHKCAVCASCCNVVAITEFPSLIAFVPVRQAELAEPFVLIYARPSQVPDRPPRA